MKMKERIHELKMPGLTQKEKVIVWYFLISFCLLSVGGDSPGWAITLVVFNFVNAARLFRKVPIHKIEE